MPKLDGSGPMGQGAMTGRARGNCEGARSGRPSSCGRRLRLGLNRASLDTPLSLEVLDLEEKVLRARLDFVLAQKESLKQ